MAPIDTFDAIEVVRALADTAAHAGEVAEEKTLRNVVRILEAKARNEITARTLICSFCRRWLEHP